MNIKVWVTCCSSRHTLVDSNSFLFLFLLLAFTSTSDAKPLEFYEGRGLKSFENDSRSTMNKNLRDFVFQEHELDSNVAVANGVEKLKNNLAVVEQSAEALSADMSVPSFSTEVGLNEEKASHEVPEAAESCLKEFNVAESALEHSDIGKIPVKQEVCFSVPAFINCSRRLVVDNDFPFCGFHLG